VCTGHCTVQCPVHRQPRAKSIFLCAVRWFTGQLLCAVRCAPDRHCRLSGAPISRFKKRPPARAEPEAHYFSLPAPSSLCLWRLLPVAGDPPHRHALSPAKLRRPRPVLLGQQAPLFLPCLHSLSVLCLRQSSSSLSPLLLNFNSCEIQCNQVLFCVPLYSLNTPAGS
jgi:hypothetical protein